jgi:DNA-directed RNA polymerase specialized sigma54-like protein
MLHQSQLQKQSFKILPQQIQMLGIYHLNTIQLEQRIKDELDENPLLENNSEEEHLEAAPKRTSRRNTRIGKSMAMMTYPITKWRTKALSTATM